MTSESGSLYGECQDKNELQRLKNRKAFKRRVLTTKSNILNSALNADIVDHLILAELFEEMNRAYREFEKTEEDYAELVDVPEDEQYSRYVEDFLKIKTKVLKILKSSNFQIQSNEIIIGTDQRTGTSTHSGTEEDLRQNHPLNVNRTHSALKPLNVPIFTGSFADWPSWRDTFESLVGKTKELTNVEKMHHLKTALQGEPLNLIADLPVTSQNFEIAWEKISSRYDRPKKIMESIVNNFIELAPVKGNPKQLRKIVDTIDSTLQRLDKMGPEASSRDPWIIALLKDKLDEETKRQWNQKMANNRDYAFKDFYSFLDNRCYALEEEPVPPVIPNHKNKSVRALHTTHSSSCTYCKRPHFIFHCKEFRKLSITERRKQASNLMLCFNCLNTGHSANDCISKYTCSICKIKHHTLLHHDGSVTSTQNDAIRTLSNISSTHGIRKGWIATIVAKVDNGIGDQVSCRIMLDPGSESSFVTKDLVSKLQLKSKKMKILVEGLQNHQAEVAKSSVNLTLRSVYKSDNAIQIDALVLSSITQNLPANDLPFKRFDLIAERDMADPYFYKSRKIDILIGALDYYDIVYPNSILKAQNELRLMNTLFGWIVGGEQPKETSHTRVNLSHTTDLQQIEKNLAKFWEIEELPQESNLSIEESKCETLYNETTKRDSTGRYMVRLPFKFDPPQLGNSEFNALQNFYSLERRLTKNEALANEYKDFMNGYVKLNHMEIVPHEQCRKDKNTYYVPHHGVYKDGKIRVVFNASAKTTNSKSLNDQLMTGPKLQTDVRSVLLRFRSFKFVFGTDIEKMFRQILIQEQDVDYLRLFWRDSIHQKPSIYRMKTVMFGLDCSPYLAQKTILRLVEDEGQNLEKASDTLLHDRYVDDIYRGSNDIEQLIETRDELIKLLAQGGFSLKKWVSNDARILKGIPEGDCAMERSRMFQEDFSVKSLGLHWTPMYDTFVFKITLLENPIMSKRKLLSELAKIFDPFGWLAPVIIVIKIIMQDLWKTHLGWDDTLPLELQSKWLNLRSNLKNLESISIPRWLGISQPYDLYGFADSSSKAYGAVVYVRNSSQERLQLVMSKTKVAPIKEVTIPRLELCAALLLAELINFISSSISENVRNKYCFSDSQIVLCWLKKSPSDLKPFVGNRVEKIIKLSADVKWSYIRTDQNPADLCSRGVTVEMLINSNLWWQGPPPEIIDQRFEDDNNIDLPDLRKPKTKCYVLQSAKFSLIEKFSRLTKLVRVTAYCLRFSQLKSQSPLRPFSATELKNCLLRLVAFEQRKYFPDTISRLKIGKMPKNNDPLLPLNPIIDDQSLIRVGGRLINADLEFDAKHPLILPYESCLSVLLIRHEHIDGKHIGIQTVISNLRQQFWIIKARALVKRVLSQCLVCFRYKPRSCTQLMGSLPSYRVRPVGTFVNVGIDYAGPFQLRPVRKRGVLTVKYYIAVFVCLSSKAIHLETVSDLSKEACLATINRFISRRGRPIMIVSDNGTNFVGAKNYLDAAGEILKSTNLNNEIMSELAIKAIDWKFIPARSPEFGGLWEASVKSCKSCLLKCTKDAKLTIEEFNTLIIEIEAALNSRPLCYLSNDTETIETLTPGHLLIGRALKSVPETNIYDKNLTLGARWDYVQKCLKDFWSRWSVEYMQSLQVRSKNQRERRNIQIGQIGLLKDDLKIPFYWKLGKVVSTHPGNDGLVRVIDIKTENGLFKRSVKSFFPLPAESSTNDLEDPGENVENE